MKDREPTEYRSNLGDIARDILGMKPSAREQAEVVRIQREGAADIDRIKTEGEARLAEIQARIDAHNADIARRKAALKEQLDHMPKRLDSVTDMSFGPDGRIDMEQFGRIHRNDDGYGNIVYTVSKRGSMGLSLDQIGPVGQRIQAQQTAFGELSEDQQTIVRREFDSNNTVTTLPYQDFLQNEALGKKFDALKANPPRPSFGDLK